MEINKNEKYSIERFEIAIPTSNTYLSNFYQLDNPIIDEFNNKYWNSEGYYMAQRIDDLDIKIKISELSKLGGKYSKKAKRLYELYQNEYNRLEYMRNAIKLKFDNNLDLKEMLLNTNKEIIEKNYWNDTFFGVSDTTLKGANILGKLLMEYRNINNDKIKGFII